MAGNHEYRTSDVEYSALKDWEVYQQLKNNIVLSVHALISL
jgi:hypothetical protein